MSLVKRLIHDTESLIAICFVIIAILIFVGGQDPALKNTTTDNYGPSFFPNIFASILFLCSLSMLSKRWHIISHQRPGSERGCYTPKELKNLFLLIIICPIILAYLGFIAMSIIASLLFCKILSLSMKESVVLCLGLTAGIYVLFDIFLKVQLPTCIFF